MTSNKLHRSRIDRMIAGVCGGLADYFDIDPTIVRVLFVVSIFIGGGGILAYVILWIVVPEETILSNTVNDEANNEQTSSKFDSDSFNVNIKQKVDETTIELNKIVDEARNNKKVFGGIFLILLGVIFLLDNLFPHFDFGDYWPIIIIAIGIGIILKAIKD